MSEQSDGLSRAKEKDALRENGALVQSVTFGAGSCVCAHNSRVVFVFPFFDSPYPQNSTSLMTVDESVSLSRSWLHTCGCSLVRFCSCFESDFVGGREAAERRG
ncbi:hypothetical protein HRR77_007651 [Exophiala dermatitidis]|nr:hypothetical protein HRR77_007651 [Exophiala dermatitidis]